MTPVFGSYLVEMFTEPAKGRRGERVAWMQERSENAIALCGRLYGGLIAEGLYPELSSLRPGISSSSIPGTWRTSDVSA